MRYLCLVRSSSDNSTACCVPAGERRAGVRGPGAVVVLPDLATARRWSDSEQDRHARSLREGVAELRMIAVEAV